ncbi:MAG: hypothetical protein O2960_28510 [Verrucomicrobia bacterium]|nr:hypothetical protein [Verrucomicrobiota bacterium]
MLLTHVPVGSHRECSAVGMTKPAAYGWNIDPGSNAAGGEKVTQVVMGYSRNPNALTGPREGFLALPQNANTVG